MASLCPRSKHPLLLHRLTRRRHDLLPTRHALCQQLRLPLLQQPIPCRSPRQTSSKSLPPSAKMSHVNSPNHASFVSSFSSPPPPQTPIQSPLPPVLQQRLVLQSPSSTQTAPPPTSLRHGHLGRRPECIVRRNRWAVVKSQPLNSPV